MKTKNIGGLQCDVFSEVFCKKRCSKKFRKLHRKTPVLKSLLKAFRTKTLLKETPAQMFSSEYCKIFKNTYFEQHL